MVALEAAFHSPLAGLLLKAVGVCSWLLPAVSVLRLDSGEQELVAQFKSAEVVHVVEAWNLVAKCMYAGVVVILVVLFPYQAELATLAVAR
jgi:hypothetical protein